MRALVLLCFSILLAISGYAVPKQIDVDNEIGDVSADYDGIDVSSYQQDIDWSATARDNKIKFVYVKATEGATYVSRHYSYNIENARRQGIKVGSYHFLRATSTIAKQFENFKRSVNKIDQDLVPLIDVEAPGNWTPTQLADSVEAFANLIEEYYGCRPMIYTSSSFYNHYLTRFANYPLFIARYSPSAPQLTGGVKYVLWQFSSKGRISGIDHNVDVCRFNKGCDLSDILIKNNKLSFKRHNVVEEARNVRVNTTVKVPKEKESTKSLTKQEKKQLEEQKKIQEEGEKRAKKEAEKKAKQEAKLKAEQMKAQKEADKHQQELKRKLEQQQQKEAKERAKKMADSIKNVKKNNVAPATNNGNTKSTKKVNQSSADNDDDVYSAKSVRSRKE
jgi:lysozyme